MYSYRIDVTFRMALNIGVVEQIRVRSESSVLTVFLYTYAQLVEEL
jgi:hypothetical protein